MELDLKEYKDLKNKLDNMDEDELMYISEDGEAKYVVLPLDMYRNVEDYLDIIGNPDTIKVVAPLQGNLNLSFDEYEKIKKQLLKVFEESFKPNPEKLN